MWTLPGCLGAVLGDVLRRIDEAAPWRAGPAPDRSAPRARTSAPPDAEPPPGRPTEATAPTSATPGRSPLDPEVEVPDPTPVDEDAPTRWAEPPFVAAAPDEPFPPGPWRWRWMWPAPARPGGMALVAADDTLVLWSPGGFAGHDGPPDGRPTPEVAVLLASVPELAASAASAEELRDELDRALATAVEARHLLHRAANAVDDAIDRREP